jgi:hypothetical protein
MQWDSNPCDSNKPPLEPSKAAGQHVSQLVHPTRPVLRHKGILANCRSVDLGFASEGACFSPATVGDVELASFRRPVRPAFRPFGRPFGRPRPGRSLTMLTGRLRGPYDLALAAANKLPSFQGVTAQVCHSSVLFAAVGCFHDADDRDLRAPSKSSQGGKKQKRAAVELGKPTNDRMLLTPTRGEEKWRSPRGKNPCISSRTGPAC